LQTLKLFRFVKKLFATVRNHQSALEALCASQTQLLQIVTAIETELGLTVESEPEPQAVDPEVSERKQRDVETLEAMYGLDSGPAGEIADSR
jgi:hypothetical protein